MASDAAAVPSTEQVLTDTNDALQELMKSRESMKQILEYCKAAFATDDQNRVYTETEQYLKDAITNIAYHSHNIGALFVTLFDLQDIELERLNLQVQSIQNSLSMTRTLPGSNDHLTNPDALKYYSPELKSAKLDDSPSAKPLPLFERSPLVIECNRYDAVGIDITKKGLASVSSNNFPARSAERTPAPPPAVAPPTLDTHGDFDAPPPDFLPPPPEDLPPPPPPGDAGDIPPPPPPR